jgi:ABC-2 type transport system permease protein
MNPHATWVEIKRGLIRKARSPVELITETLAAYIFLTVAILAASGRAVTSGCPEGAGFLSLPADELLFSLVCVFFCLGALQGVARLATEEPGSGIVEQLSSSQIPLWRIGLIRDVASVVNFVPNIAIIILAVSVTTGARMPSPRPSALIPLILMRMGMLGIGYVLGGIAILAARIGGLVNLVSVGLFAMAFAPPDATTGAMGLIRSMLPYGRCYHMAHEIVFGRAAIGDYLASGALVSTAILAASYFMAGVAIFNKAFAIALDRGALGKS